MYTVLCFQKDLVNHFFWFFPICLSFKDKITFYKRRYLLRAHNTFVISIWNIEFHVNFSPFVDKIRDVGKFIIYIYIYFFNVRGQNILKLSKAKQLVFFILNFDRTSYTRFVDELCSGKFIRSHLTKMERFWNDMLAEHSESNNVRRLTFYFTKSSLFSSVFHDDYI